MNIVITSILAFAFLATPSAPARAADVEPDEGIGPIVEQIDIMRVVLTKSINAACGEHVGADTPEPTPESVGGTTGAIALNRYAATLARRGSQFTSHTRGFYADGIGVLFTTEVRAPVVVPPAAEGEPVDPDGPDEWDEAAAEVRGEARTPRLVGVPEVGMIYTTGRQDADTVSATIDEAFIDATIEAVLGSLGNYGRRMEDLRADEGVIVAIRFEPDQGTWLGGLFPTPAPPDAPEVAGNSQGRGASVGRSRGGSGGGGAGRARAPRPPRYSVSSPRGIGAHYAAPQRVVIWISRRDLDRLEGSETRDLDAVRRAVRITRH